MDVAGTAQLWIDPDGLGAAYGYGTLAIFQGLTTAQISIGGDIIV